MREPNFNPTLMLYHDNDAGEEKFSREILRARGVVSVCVCVYVCVKCLATCRTVYGFTYLLTPQPYMCVSVSVSASVCV